MLTDPNEQELLAPDHNHTVSDMNLREIIEYELSCYESANQIVCMAPSAFISSSYRRRHDWGGHGKRAE